MIESLILGTAQGIAEWLPISSEGLILFIQTYIGELSVTETIRFALFLHLGTFLAALIYFRKEVIELTKDLFRYTSAEPAKKKLLNFYLTSTLLSGGLGYLILKVIEGVEGRFEIASKYVIVALGILLLITGWLQIIRKKNGNRDESGVRLSDGILLGIAQGLAVFPGLSRSGLTTSALLLRKFKDTVALKLSFIMSLPIVLGGNILLNQDKFSFSVNNLLALGASFLFGILTIHALLKLAEKMEFGWFVVGFAVLVFASAFFV